MDWLLVALLIGNIYVVVYFRLMILHYGPPTAGARATGLLAVLSFPSRESLPEDGIRYYRRYWLALAAFVVLVVLGAALRFPSIVSSLNPVY